MECEERGPRNKDERGENKEGEEVKMKEEGGKWRRRGMHLLHAANKLT